MPLVTSSSCSITRFLWPLSLSRIAIAKLSKWTHIKSSIYLLGWMCHKGNSVWITALQLFLLFFFTLLLLLIHRCRFSVCLLSSFKESYRERESQQTTIIRYTRSGNNDDADATTNSRPIECRYYHCTRHSVRILQFDSKITPFLHILPIAPNLYDIYFL